ncbi:MAG TPA: glutamyl-tRNA reductase [Deltaproteobacteria bacterium]|nr:MAG: glutamyl-tRNA reductase [Deltaproteobacteria bacterium GWA2_55_82]OGQ62607.1 MAG: glutamyl-tRNA reductase [Deltaproteobacteria bacterium RIFCSPLOWO2_02_FULL_55_12]OIJ74197.1 MAG: glutamyl-tRNA reductase [Deltaproteobacteria bacterium GWC2_55_46]HBG46820.1 glutamyl-tRNA reductase [Deltaproteobacteria bacterium]HCY11171.1 glutamyl-tRNA reductase [Deltaproteobacteria bacterium]
MNLVIVGLNHKTSPIEIREKLSFPSQTIGEPLARLTNHYGLAEGVILSTCNRVEVLAITSEIEKGTWQIKRFLSDYHSIPLEKLDEHLYVHQGEEAVKHLFRVAAGLDSMVMGEPQILGQVKDSYGYAVQHNTAGIIVNKLYHKAFQVAKRVRTETKIGESAVSISFAAVELARKIFGELAGKTCMLVGAGEMAELAARHLQSNGVREILVANRTYEKAVDLVKCFCGTAIMFREFPHYLKNVDIVIASTASPNFIIKPEQIHDVMRERKNRPMFFIDISVPRNVDPEVNTIDNCYVYDVDDLQGVVVANLHERQKEALQAEGIIAEEIELFYRWIKSLDVVPTIIALRKSFDSVRKAELAKAVSTIPSLGEKELKVLEAMTSAIVNKILHHPVTHLKREANKIEGDLYIDTIRKLFDLTIDEEAVKKAAQSNDD